MLTEDDKSKLMQDKEYELYVKDVLDRINAADGWENIQLQHNVVLTGKSGATHQIDIYWEFQYGVMTHKVAVECKGYNSRVSEEKIAAFHGVLEDLDGVQGVYASQMGYQSGAIILAKHFNIKLLEIRRPLNKDIEGRIWNIGLKFVLNTIVNPRLMIGIDQEDVDLETANRIEGTIRPDETWIIEGDQKKTISELVKDFNHVSSDGHQCFVREYTNAYLLQEGKMIRITNIKYEYDVVSSSTESILSGDDVIKALVKDLTDGDEKTIDWRGQIRQRK